LTKGIDSIAKASFDNRIIAIKDFATGALKSVTDTWVVELNREVGIYNKVGQVAADRQLPGAFQFRVKIDTVIAAASNLPKDLEAARNLAGILQGLPDELKRLGLDGNAGKFLIAVAEGNGSARGLDDKSTRELLDRYNLWDSLSVGFR
jgi:hypothetical protein